MNLKTISLGSLILLAAASGWSERPCGGAVNSVYIEGPYSVSALAVNNHRMVTADREFTLTSWDLDDPDAPTVEVVDPPGLTGPTRASGGRVRP